MRNTIRIAIVLVLLVQTAFAQENISNRFYFKYAISTPTNGYYSYKDWGSESDIAFKRGGAIEIGSFLYFKNLDLGPKSKLGFDVSYLSISKHAMGYEVDFGIGTLEQKHMFYNIGSKLGPVYTYNVLDKLNVDVFAKVNPIWMNVAIEDNQDVDPLKYYTGAMGFKYGFGMNVRYDFVVLGAEFNTGKLKYQSQDDKDVYIGDIPLIPSEKETNSPTFNLSLGFCF